MLSGTSVVQLHLGSAPERQRTTSPRGISNSYALPSTLSVSRPGLSSCSLCPDTDTYGLCYSKKSPRKTAVEGCKSCCRCIDSWRYSHNPTLFATVKGLHRNLCCRQGRQLGCHWTPGQPQIASKQQATVATRSSSLLCWSSAGQKDVSQILFSMLPSRHLLAAETLRHAADPELRGVQDQTSTGSGSYK